MISIYLDNAAKTQVKKEVLDVIIKSLEEDWYNPSSSYQPGVEVKNKIEQVRKLIADKINAKPNEIFFTSGGCEGNSWVIDNFDHILYDPLSHESIKDIIKKKNNSQTDVFGRCYPGKPISLTKLIVDEYGKLDLFFIEEEMKEFEYGSVDFSEVFTICGANNEIGTVQSIKYIKNLLERNNKRLKEDFLSENCGDEYYYGTHKNFLLHIDGTQMLPYMKIDVQDLGVDIMTFSGAKIGCPSGIGFMYVNGNLQNDRFTRLEQIIGGAQENGLRGGTENVPYILGLGKAMQLLDTDTSHLESLRDYFINKLLTLPNTKLVGSKINRLPNNVNICFGNIDASALLSYLNLNGIYASSGSACNSNSLEPSHVLKEIGLSDIEANSCVRFTLSNETTVEELEETFSVIERFVTRQNKYLGKGE
ncbi:cysteine desulfurase family protein [Faecalibacillus intestinalis]|uniref:cysteine desulfurase family protein n=1 Tax=Faecalibacillus intestinalis TaxID=1982626 RepID=UPI00296203CD|nr:aminotransferase class V-fold PLP-dependent enzyme [Faecalibacillus intestinalis]